MHILEPLLVDITRIEEVLNALEQALSGQRSLLPVPDIQSGLIRSLRAFEAIDPQVALVVATSGSTGTPKGALLTPRNLISSADATHQVLGGEGGWLLAMPGHHIAGIQVLVRSIVAGIEPIVQDVSKGFHVQDFARGAQALTDCPRRYTAACRRATS